MKIASIQFLRAIAVILVVYAYSIELTMRFHPIQDSNHLAAIGFIGQDLFFVICGFIITHTAAHYNGLEEGFLFLQKKFIRINPLYYLATLLYIGCHVMYGWYGSHMIPMPFNMMLTSYADTLLIVPTTAELSGFKPLMHSGWILGFGWLFYALFAITILAKVKHKIPALGVILISLAGVGYFLKPTDLRLQFLTNPILLEFLLGILLHQLYLRIRKVHVTISIGLLMAGIGWSVFLVFRGYGFIFVSNAILTGFLSLNRVLHWGIPAAAIIAGCLFLEREGKLTRLWNNPLFRHIGDASYSIYLIHAAVFSLLTLLYNKLSIRIAPNFAIYLQVLVAALIGLGFYRLVEKPLQRWLTKVANKAMKLTVSSTHPSPST